MKSIRKMLLVAGISASWLSFSYAQQTSTGLSADGFQILMQAVVETPPMPAAASPRPGNFYTFQHGPSWPPMPANFMNLPFWDLGNRCYVVDDRSVDYAALQAQAAAEALLLAAPNSGFSTMASSRLNSSFAYGNPVYLTNLVVSANGSRRRV